MSRKPVSDFCTRSEILERLEAAQRELEPGGDGRGVADALIAGVLEEIRQEIERGGAFVSRELVALLLEQTRGRKLIADLAAIDREVLRYHRQLAGLEPWSEFIPPPLRDDL